MLHWMSMVMVEQIFSPFNPHSSYLMIIIIIIGSFSVISVHILLTLLHSGFSCSCNNPIEC